MSLGRLPGPRRPLPRRGERLALVVAGSLILAACSPPAAATVPSLPAPASTGASAPASNAVPGSGAPSSAPSASAAIPVDEGLLTLLPRTLAGLDRQRDPTVDAAAFADPSLAAFASAGATAVYVDPASGDFAYASLLRLTTGGIDDAAFRAYRDSFDRGACSQAGGVAGHAEASLGGRTTWIGSCRGGLLTYHTVLPSSHVIVSISSAGSHRLGEQLANAISG